MIKKAQISFEFIMIFTLVFTALTGFIYLINNQMQDISKKQEQLVMKNLADSIVNEVVLASSFNNNYMRRFKIPTHMFGQRYNISLQGEFVLINVLENDETRLEYLAALPVYVKGSFVQNITQNTSEHCITKNNYDGIRISQNQASLDAEEPEVTAGNEFDVYVSLHCVEDAKSFEITIEYNPDKVEFKEAFPVIRDVEFKDNNPLFSDYNIIYNYENSVTPDNPEIGRVNYGFLGKSCEDGSGNVALLRFRALDDAQGVTEIKFDERLSENLKILDCQTNKKTKDGLPDTKKNAVIEIV
jgi:hypothetical protein